MSIDALTTLIARWRTIALAAVGKSKPEEYFLNRCADELEAALAARAVAPPTSTADAIEALAEAAHVAWAGWMRYLFKKGSHRASGDVLISNEWRERWQRQIDTPYAELREDEKESDRQEARRFLAALRAALPGLRESDAITWLRKNYKRAASLDGPRRGEAKCPNCGTTDGVIGRQGPTILCCEQHRVRGFHGSLDGPRPQQPVPLTLWQELRDALGQEDQTLLFRLKQMDLGRDRQVWIRELDAQMRGEK